ncbi:MAG: 3-phosphoshikimate 1-carboxyvinyltransferase [Thermoanaerobaculales bacterium]
MRPSLLPGPRKTLCASVAVPPSKSLTNRAMIMAAAAGGGSVLSPLDCEDTRLLAEALAAAGWSVDWHDVIDIGERRVPDHRIVVELGNSGTGARLLLSLLAAVPGCFVVDGSPRLRERPLAPLLDCLVALGAELRSADGRLPVEIDGMVLGGGKVWLRPEVSSQFVSSLVLAAPLMTRGMELEVVGPLPSAPYLDLTEDVLRAFGARVKVGPKRRLWQVSHGLTAGTRYRVEGDWSAAAFAVAAQGVAGGEVDVGPLDRHSRQGDRVVCEILAPSGVRYRQEGDRLLLRGSAGRAFSADLSDAPDLFPALAVVAAAAPAGSVFSGLDHLKHKESDRLDVMVENLRRLGARVSVDGSRLHIASPMRREHLEPPEVTAAGDHRIAMAMAVAALAVGPLHLDDASCVAKSFPGFWSMWDGLVAEGGWGRHDP